MNNKDPFARELAERLLQINAIKLNVRNPFTWASGLLAPIYCDNRRILSFPELRNWVADRFVDVIRKHYPDVELIAGVATGAIAIGVLVAERMDLPFVYVRSKPKSHGLASQVEGDAPAGKMTVIVEDLVSTAKSSLQAYHALREKGLRILGMVSIFTYDLNIAVKNLENAGCNLFSLSNYDALLETAINNKIISDEDLIELKKWRKDPENWHQKILRH